MNGAFPANYYLCTAHSCTYIVDSIALSLYPSHFIFTYCVFDRTLIVVIKVYMYVPCIFPYINRCNNTMFFFPCSVLVDFYLRFLFIYLVIHYLPMSIPGVNDRHDLIGIQDIQPEGNQLNSNMKCDLKSKILQRAPKEAYKFKGTKYNALVSLPVLSDSRPAQDLHHQTS